MSYFPLCINLAQQRVLLIGDGPQIREKLEKLTPFAPQLVRLSALQETDLIPRPAIVVVGDLTPEASLRCSILCREHNIPINIVDQPELCSFFFPSLICKGDLTVSLSTGGKSPVCAALLRKMIEAVLPERIADILCRMDSLRHKIHHLGTPSQRKKLLTVAAEKSFAQNRPLSDEEIHALIRSHFP